MGETDSLDIEWVTLSEAASNLSNVFGKEFSEGKVLQWALAGRLKLSVYFVNGAIAKECKIIPPSELDGMQRKLLGLDGAISLQDGSVLITNPDLLILADRPWDLPMVGNERFYVEQQLMNSTGAKVRIERITEGTFVEDLDGRLYQIQIDSAERNLRIPVKMGQRFRFKLVHRFQSKVDHLSERSDAGVFL